jgi:DNA-binding NarL/FixJ family response regulator
LSQRERQVLDLVEEGLGNKDIANALGIEPGTVKIHLRNIFAKTGVHRRFHLALAGLKGKAIPALPAM